MKKDMLDNLSAFMYIFLANKMHGSWLKSPATKSTNLNSSPRT